MTEIPRSDGGSVDARKVLTLGQGSEALHQFGHAGAIRQTITVKVDKNRH